MVILPVIERCYLLILVIGSVPAKSLHLPFGSYIPVRDRSETGMSPYSRRLTPLNDIEYVSQTYLKQSEPPY